MCTLLSLSETLALITESHVLMHDGVLGFGLDSKGLSLSSFVVLCWLWLETAGPVARFSE